MNESSTYDELLVCFRHIVFSLLAGSYIHLVLVLFSIFHFFLYAACRLGPEALCCVFCCRANLSTELRLRLEIHTIIPNESLLLYV
jgi:hypothetical protein